jgi:glycosyltransferase involved in cell wall biosynthesis
MVKRRLRARYGWFPLCEVRNKVALFPSYPGLRHFENSELRRLGAALSRQRPRALVATILLTYKRPEGLRAALDSILAQTFTDHIVMVVDDGAGLPADLPDDPRVFTISLARNIGVLGVERNIGIRLTDSRYVAFLDDDNTWRPDHLAVALERLRSDPPGDRPDAVYTALRRITPDGRERDILSVPFDRILATERAFLDSNCFVARRTPALMYSRLRRSRDVAPKEDWEMIYRYGRRHRIEHIPVPTVNYLVNPDSYWTAWNVPSADPAAPTP